MADYSTPQVSFMKSSKVVSFAVFTDSHVVTGATALFAVTRETALLLYSSGYTILYHPVTTSDTYDTP